MSDLTRFNIHGTDPALIHTWEQLVTLIGRELGPVGDSGVGMGRGDISFEYGGKRYAVSIQIEEDTH